MIKVKDGVEIHVQGGGCASACRMSNMRSAAEHGVQVMAVHQFGFDTLRREAGGDVVIERAVGGEKEDPAAGNEQEMGE